MVFDMIEMKQINPQAENDFQLFIAYSSTHRRETKHGVVTGSMFPFMMHFLVDSNWNKKNVTFHDRITFYLCRLCRLL
jgi:hypothetical protein